MKTSRICAGVVATLALFAAGHARADGVAAGDTVVLNTFQTIWSRATPSARVQNGAPRIGKNTGAGLMDAQFTFDARKANPAEVLLGTTFTRSAATKNQNAANDSYMQGGFALATLTDKGVVPGAVVDLPALEGERTWMRPQIALHAEVHASSSPRARTTASTTTRSPSSTSPTRRPARSRRSRTTRAARTATSRRT